MNKNTSWGNVADWYDDVVSDRDSYQNKVILPNLLRIVAPEKGKSILDIACGQGFFSHAMAAKGAKVVGVDIGAALIDIAKKDAVKSGTKNEVFHVMSAENLSGLKDGEFDASFCVLAIQNIEHMAKAFKEASRVTKSGGKFIIVMNHPSFRIPGQSSWGFDEKAGVQYRRVDEYLSESRKAMDMKPGTPGAEITHSFHRPLQVYSKTLANAGFTILRIEEWISHRESEAGPKKVLEDKARREIPLFMCLECVKLS